MFIVERGSLTVISIFPFAARSHQRIKKATNIIVIIILILIVTVIHILLNIIIIIISIIRVPIKDF